MSIVFAIIFLLFALFLKRTPWPGTAVTFYHICTIM